MAVQLSDAAASALADQITALVDAGAGPGVIEVYTGTLPADLDPTGDTLLLTFTLADPAAAAAVAGVAPWDVTPALSATVAASGTAGWFLVADSNGVAVFGGNVATSAAPMTFANLAWTLGDDKELSAASVTAPKA